ncbi:XRE family transcriptional regulator [Yersinia enterocolitica]|uniref:SIS domain-containing protein n=1 Tax=Yersinia enterocolitica TaxID=630 RepID=UPI00083DA0D7|nr:SIS domain-containing protein [Yersinia enterocolitica]AOF17798.1 XRE family transcriptional regulator [Yersinia enterocolitica]AOF22332.1 XRE family transcriptional regulator [Yersinia enterocolitica]AOF26041.1 XRE family transcriptional regulator [Yersinia enterocolitica]AOF30153.1 XRE family transcriptional regulator [Yersinia enterocolitica]AOF34073.1 XRE family transcriptional regulator [Yersinia enterocolitica]
MSIFNEITWLLPELAENQKKIAKCILDNPESILSISSSQFAEDAGVSQSAIVKFSQKIGMKGFPALKIAISEELSRNNLFISYPHKALHNSISSEDSLMVMAQKLAREKTASIMETTRKINFFVFQQVISLINTAQRVQIVGIWGSGLTAKDLSYKLQKIGIMTLVEADLHVQIAAALTLTPKDVQIVLSFTGRRKDMRIAATVAKAQGATVIAITGSKVSPLAKIADYVLESISDENEWRSSSISSRTAQNTLTELIFLALMQQRKEMAKPLILNASMTINNLDD